MNNVRVISVFFSALIIALNLGAQGLALEWAEQVNGNGTSDADGIIVRDVYGYIYISGRFKGTVDFDPGPGTFSLTAVGIDAFITKLDSSGNFIWAKQFVGSDPSDQCGGAVAIDLSGNIYVSGSFSGLFDFDPGPGTYFQNSYSNVNAFIAKLDASGNFIWAKHFSSVWCQALSIALDPSANLIIGGEFEDTVDFNPGAGVFNLVSAMDRNGYITKLDSSGNFVWAVPIVTDTLHRSGVSSVTSDSNGNVYVTGVRVDQFQADDLFVAKYDASANLIWERFLGHGYWEPIITLDKYENIYISGLDLATKLDTTGSILWSTNLVNSGDCEFCWYSSITTDASGNTYVGGYFWDDSNFGSGYISPNGGFDMVICKIDSFGNIKFAQTFGSVNNDRITSISIDENDDIYILGSFGGVIDIDPGPNMLSLSPSGRYDLVLLKLNSLSGSSILLNLKLFLSGPYDSATGLMHDSLRTKGLIPLTEPYSAQFTHYFPGGGETMDTSVLQVADSNAIVDWVFIELRDKTDTSVVATRSALLQRDGDVVDVDGASPVSFEGTSPDDYFIAVRHRNHLGVMTATTYSLSFSSSLIDFTTIPTFGINAMQELSGVHAMWSGNALPDKFIKFSGPNNDRDPIFVRIGGVVPTNVIMGYFPEDVNMDGFIKLSGPNNDSDIILFNIGGIVPTNVVVEQLP